MNQKSKFIIGSHTKSGRHPSNEFVTTNSWNAWVALEKSVQTAEQISAEHHLAEQDIYVVWHPRSAINTGTHAVCENRNGVACQALSRERWWICKLKHQRDWKSDFWSSSSPTGDWYKKCYVCASSGTVQKLLAKIAICLPHLVQTKGSVPFHNFIMENTWIRMAAQPLNVAVNRAGMSYHDPWPAIFYSQKQETMPTWYRDLCPVGYCNYSYFGNLDSLRQMICWISLNHKHLILKYVYCNKNALLSSFPALQLF